jgi:nitrate/nitrite-specific signal transduction histidine kinase
MLFRNYSETLQRNLELKECYAKKLIGYLKPATKTLLTTNRAIDVLYACVASLTSNMLHSSIADMLSIQSASKIGYSTIDSVQIADRIIITENPPYKDIDYKTNYCFI